MAVTKGIFAQRSDNIQETKSPIDIGREYEILEDSTVNYLMPVYQLKKLEANFTDNQRRFEWVQAYPTYLSRLTNERIDTKKAIAQFRNNRPPISSENALQTNHTALNYLIQKSKDERVVMINENHYAPHHRILAEILMDSLYNYGFSYLAMEAIWEDDTVLNKRGFAITNTGFYTREPMMANLIRKAIEKGYYVFGYDDYTNDREKNQARNIFQKTLDKDTLSKVLVLAGFGHIDKTERTRNWMAREFFLLTRIEPFTINQDFETEDTYLMILDATTRNIYTSDILVANNIDYEEFIIKNGYKNYNIPIPAEIAEKALSQSLMFVVSVFKANEYQSDKTAIPGYNHALSNDLSNISINLPVDTYLYVIKDRYGKVVFCGNF